MEKQLATRQRAIGDACAQCGWQRKSFASWQRVSVCA